MVLTLNMNIRLPLFWTRSRARGPDSAPFAGLADGRNCSDCRASEEMSQKCLAGLLAHEYLKTMAKGEGFSTLTPQTVAAFLCSLVLTKFLNMTIQLLLFLSTWSPGQDMCCPG